MTEKEKTKAKQKAWETYTKAKDAAWKVYKKADDEAMAEYEAEIKKIDSAK